MSKEEQLLTERLATNIPLLFLGAGFSTGARNQCGELPNALRLKEDIYRKFYGSEKRPKYISEADLKEIQQFNLGELCNNIQQEDQKRKEELKTYLVKRFKDTKGKPYHELLVEYPWKRIYTLNIDDLVENIYKEKEINLIIQNQTELKEYKERELELYKLHGCVNAPERGFIFSTDEYEDTILGSDFKLQKFCTDYYDNDVVFLGTELNEDDISILLKKYLNAGFRSNAHKYFFVSPNIKLKLKNMIKNNMNYYHIPWTTEQFLSYCAHLKKEDDEKQKLEELMKQYNFWNLTEHQKIPAYFESKLYFGNAPIWADIYDKWDFLAPNHQKKIEQIQRETNNCIISIFGKAYVGKTVLAKRILVEFHKEGYQAFEFDFKSYDEMEIFRKFMSLLPEGSKVALLIEEAALQYYNIAQMINTVSDNIEHLVVITTSRRYYHSIKRHELLRCQCYEIESSNRINYNFSFVILDKLKEKNRTGELSRYINRNNESECRKFILDKKNIVDLLYTLNHGRGFQEYFLYKFEQMDLDSECKKLFIDCCILSALGIVEYPHAFTQMLHKAVTRDKVTRQLEDIVDIEQDDIKVRCSEVFEQKVINELSSEQKRECIEKHLICIDKRFYENSNNVWESVFEKLLKTKALSSILKMNQEDIRILFVSLEKKYAKISYYWMQRGIFLQSLTEFENAELFLKQALSIRPGSYQIRHALAKNNLERSLYELENGKESFAPYYFEEGEKSILELIQSPKYSNALCYSVHTYIDMKIKYCSKMHTITENILQDLYQYLIEGARVNYDQYIKHARNLLYDNAVKIQLDTLAEKLLPVNFEVYVNKDFIDLEMMAWD